MMIDVLQERGGLNLVTRWGHEEDCHFPLFNHLKPLSLPYMAILYGIMWIGNFALLFFFFYVS
jgi:vitamin K-dependent gamma-carboxylase